MDDYTGFQAAFVLVLLLVIAMLAFAVLILVEERRAPAAPAAGTSEPLTLFPDDAEDEAGEPCTVCHGSGVVDITDDWDRPIIADADCRACQGTGLVNA